MSDITWTTEKRKLGDLAEWENNPAEITEHDAKHLQRSIDKFGLALPLVANVNGDLIDGHQRKTVMLMLGKYAPDTQVDVRIPSRALTEQERAELAIRLRRNVGQWNWDTLANEFELDDLKDWGFTDFDFQLAGWDTDEEPPPDPGPQIDRAAELQEKWGTALGQVWELGDHRLVCGDCTDGAVVDAVMRGEKAGAVITDPPYGINREGIANDDPEGLRDLYDGALSIMPVIDAVISAFLSPRLEWVWFDACRDAGLKPERMLWMYKPNDETSPWRGWILTSESIRLFSIGKPVWVNVHPYAQDCYVYKHDESLGELQGTHTTVKPLRITQDIVSRIGGIVYDPFLGSGTTLIACERLGRRCRGIEIEPKYVAVTLERWAGLTGKAPVLISSE